MVKYKFLVVLFIMLLLSSCVNLIFERKNDKIFMQGLHLYKKEYLFNNKVISFSSLDKDIYKNIIFFKDKEYLENKDFQDIDLSNKIIYFDSNTLRIIKRVDGGSLVLNKNDKNNKGISIFIEDIYDVDGNIISYPILLKSVGTYTYKSSSVDTKVVYGFKKLNFYNKEIESDYIKFLELNRDWEANLRITHNNISHKSLRMEILNNLK